MSTPKQSIIAAYLDAVMRKDASVIDLFFAPDVELAAVEARELSVS